MANKLPLVLSSSGQVQQIQSADQINGAQCIVGAALVDNSVAPAKISDSGVTAASYTNASITVTAKGLITAASSGAGASTGTPLNVVVAETATQSGVTVIIPSDNTIPQNTEGTQILTNSITPSSASNTVLITVTGCFFVQSSTVAPLAAIFRGATANAIYTARQLTASVAGGLFSFTFLDSPATTSATTYALRVGPEAAGTVKINTDNNNNTYGGTMKVTMILTEIKG